MGVDPEIAVAAVAIIGALAHAAVAVLRGLQDYRRAAHDTRRTDPLPPQER